MRTEGNDAANNGNSLSPTSHDEEAVTVERAPSPTPAAASTTVVQVASATDSLTPTPDPSTPVDKLVELTMLAYARREDGAAARHSAVAIPNEAAPQNVSSSAPPAGADEAATIPQTPTPGYDIAPDWEDAYTGQPSFAHQVLVTGLRVVTAVTEALGIPFNLGSPSFSIPFLTDGTPPTFLMPGTDVTKRQYVDEPSGVTWEEWVITPEAPTGEQVIAVHGGGFTSEANIFTYLTYNQLARDTGATVVVPVYPVIGKGGTAATVVPVMADLIASEVRAHGAANVSVLGDSAGGSISLAALQLQAARIRKGEADPESMPSRLVLLSPSLDSNDPYTALPFDDPLLDPEVSKENRVAWLDGLDPTDPLASPVFGSLDGLPPTTVYSSSLDQITFQTLRLQQKAADRDFDFVLRKGLIHDWVVFFFLPEAQAELPGIYHALEVHPQAL
jgi:acetyl esterase/lipase